MAATGWNHNQFSSHSFKIGVAFSVATARFHYEALGWLDGGIQIPLEVLYLTLAWAWKVSIAVAWLFVLSYLHRLLSRRMWITGHSIVFWVQCRTMDSGLGSQPGLSHLPLINWLGIPGLHGEQLQPGFVEAAHFLRQTKRIGVHFSKHALPYTTANWGRALSSPMQQWKTYFTSHSIFPELACPAITYFPGEIGTVSLSQRCWAFPDVRLIGLCIRLCSTIGRVS